MIMAIIMVMSIMIVAVPSTSAASRTNNGNKIVYRAINELPKVVYKGYSKRLNLSVSGLMFFDIDTIDLTCIKSSKKYTIACNFTALKEGTATIYYTLPNQGYYDSKSGKLIKTVYYTKVTVISQKSFSSNQSVINKHITGLPSVKGKDYIWKSSNPKVATVDSFGRITKKGIGTTYISLKYKNTLIAIDKINIYKPKRSKTKEKMADYAAKFTGKQFSYFFANPSSRKYFFEGDWCDMFARFIVAKNYGEGNSIYKASTPLNRALCCEWYNKTPSRYKKYVLGKPLSNRYTPKKGDLVFFYYRGSINHVAIVYDVDKNSKVFSVVEGNWSKRDTPYNNSKVAINTYSLSNSKIYGYINMP